MSYMIFAQILSEIINDIFFLPSDNFTTLSNNMGPLGIVKLNTNSLFEWATKTTKKNTFSKAVVPYQKLTMPTWIMQEIYFALYKIININKLGNL